MGKKLVVSLTKLAKVIACKLHVHSSMCNAGVVVGKGKGQGRGRRMQRPNADDIRSTHALSGIIILSSAVVIRRLQVRWAR